MVYHAFFVELHRGAIVRDCLIITSNIDKAGTDAAVTLTLNGSTGLTYEKQVSGEFERDSWDRSLIIANTTNLGTIHPYAVSAKWSKELPSGTAKAVSSKTIMPR